MLAPYIYIYFPLLGAVPHLLGYLCLLSLYCCLQDQCDPRRHLVVCRLDVQSLVRTIAKFEEALCSLS